MLIIRLAVVQDLKAITDIYNDAVVKTTATFDIQPKTLEEQKIWFDHHGTQHPVLVAEEDQMIVGWASLSQWSDRCAYAETAEISIYIKEAFRGQGTGTALAGKIIEAGRQAGLHTLIARIVAGNSASLKICERQGFKAVGTLKEVGRKFGQLLDVVMLQLVYEKHK